MTRFGGLTGCPTGSTAFAFRAISVAALPCKRVVSLTLCPFVALAGGCLRVGESLHPEKGMKRKRCDQRCVVRSSVPYRRSRSRHLPLAPRAERAFVCPGRAATVRAAPTSANRYAGECVACGMSRTCGACLRTASCEMCTPTQRCGPCRNVHSKAHRAAGLQRSAKGARALASRQPSEHVDSIDLPRTRSGMNQYLHLVASTTSALWCEGPKHGRCPHAPLPFAACPHSMPR